MKTHPWQELVDKHLSTERQKRIKESVDHDLLEMRIDDVLLSVKQELETATKKFGPITSAHEGIAVIEEEFLELRNAVFWPNPEGDDSFAEAVQLAAMAVRFIVDLWGQKR